MFSTALLRTSETILLGQAAGLDAEVEGVMLLSLSFPSLSAGLDAEVEGVILLSLGFPSLSAGLDAQVERVMLLSLGSPLSLSAGLDAEVEGVMLLSLSFPSLYLLSSKAMSELFSVFILIIPFRLGPDGLLC
jgi:hypothetical protein